MRLTAEEKVEVIGLVVHGWDSINKSLKRLGIHKRTFYNWYHAYSQGGIEALQSKRGSKQQWNRIPDQERQLIVDLALEHTGLSSRELAVKITDEQQIFVSESSVYRILKARGLIPEAAHTFIPAADEFHTIKPSSLTRCGKRTSLISKSKAEDGIICPQSWMIIVAISFTVSYVQA